MSYIYDVSRLRVNADGRMTVAMQAHQARFMHKKGAFPLITSLIKDACINQQYLHAITSFVPTKEHSTVCVCFNHPKFSTVLLLRFVLCTVVGRDSSVCIATRYGLDGPGIESR